MTSVPCSAQPPSLAWRLIAAGTLCASLALSSAHAGSNRDNPNADWMPADVNWKETETVEVSLLDYHYEPDEVVLHANRPYKIILDNISQFSTHDLNGIDFFHSVVFAKIETDTNTVLTPHIHSLLIRPKSRAILYLVPKMVGEFPVYCGLPGHREEGMEGLFVISSE